MPVSQTFESCEYKNADIFVMGNFLFVAECKDVMCSGLGLGKQKDFVFLGWQQKDEYESKLKKQWVHS